MPRPWRTLVAGLAGAVVVTAVPAVAEPVGRVAYDNPPVAVDPTNGRGAAERPARIAMVTLVTGDRIRISTQPNGTRTVVPQPGPGRATTAFSVRYRGDRIEVVPVDAGPLLRTGRLDPRLFDVAGLVAAGMDDAKTSQLPVVARHAAGRVAAARSPSGATALRTRDAASSTALSVRKSDASSFWRWLVGSKPFEVGVRRPVGGALAAGVDTLSLRIPSASAGTATKASGQRGGRNAASPGAEAAPYGLVLRVLDRNGRLITSPDDRAFLTQPVVRNLDTNEVYDLEPRKAGIGALVPPGAYSFGEIIVTAHGFKPTSYTMLSRPDFTVRANLTLTLDTRTAHEVSVRIQAPDPKPIVTTLGTVEFFDARPWTTLVTIPAGTRFRAFATTTPEVTGRPYNFAMFQSLTSSWGIYDLLVGAAQRIPASTRYTVRNIDLTRVTSRFFSPMPEAGLEGVFFRESELPGDVQVGLGWFYDTPLPGNQVHFTSPRFGGEGVPWASSLDVGRAPDDLRYSEVRNPRILPAGENLEAPWSRASFRPEGSGERLTDRTLAISFEPFSPAVDDAQVVWWDQSGITGTATLNAAGQVADTVDEPFVFLSTAPSLPSTWYTLDLVARHDASWSKFATAVHGHWKFLADAEEDPQRIALLNVLPTGEFDLHNRAPAGRTFRLELPVSVPTEHAGRPTSTALAVSYDDGKTWKAVPTVRDGALLWHAMVTHPNKPGGFVSLRAKVFTDNGHVFSMTTIRAYGLGPAT